VVDALLRWFEKNARDLPWRKRPRRAYAVWVSEIMLQQTQVRTVVPYYRRWLRRFPSVRSLARARLGDVLKAWEGLGYYRRARMMHEAARIIVSTMGGRMPRSSKELRKLPGVGDYTAAAVASMAFGEDVVAVDGNVRRVASRLFALDGEVSRERVRQRLAGLVPRGNAGPFNEALMELGALVCTPDRPHCGRCPLRDRCRAFLADRVRELPAPSSRKPLRRVEAAAIVRLKGNRVMLKRRPLEGLLGGLWGFPLVEKTRAARLRATLLDPVSHAYSHFAVTATPTLVRGAAAPLRRELQGGKYFSPAEVARLPLSRLDHKIMEKVMAYRERHSGRQDAG
jgi:A/G-specific adenine glycosylase